MIAGRFKSSSATILSEKLCEAKLLHFASPLSLILHLGITSEHEAKRHASHGREFSSQSRHPLLCG